eukprot:jgi/Undpi1/3745/HiC_scaffold_16.g07114.m1
MDTGDLATADKQLSVLKLKFPGSQRVRLLQGMRSEAGGDFDGADEIYSEMLEENPANSLAHKRKVAVKIAKGDTVGAVKELNTYLSEFAADEEAWLQLAKLHITALNYEAAAFCYEELVLVTPSDHVVHCRLGESVDLLKAGNARALHGLCQTCASLASCKGSQKILAGKEKEVNKALHLLAAKELRKAYKAGDRKLASLADEVTRAQAASLSSD